MAVWPIIPPGLEWAYNFAVGQQWPQGNEDTLRLLAQAWREANQAIHAVVDEGNGAARQVTLSIEGPSAEEFVQSWNQWTDGPDSILGQLATQFAGFADSLEQQASDTQYTKLVIDWTLVVMFIQVVWALTMLLVSEGLSMGMVVAAMFAARESVLRAIAWFVDSVLTMTIPDVISQAIQGHNLFTSWDWGKTGQAFGSAVLFGLLGGGLGYGVGKALPFLAEPAEGIGQKLTQLGVHSLQGAVTNVAIGAPMAWLEYQGLKPDVKQWVDEHGGWARDLGAQALNGATVGLTFGLVDELGHLKWDNIDRLTVEVPDRPGVEFRVLNDGKLAIFNDRGFRTGSARLTDDGSSIEVRPWLGDPYRVDLTPGTKLSYGRGPVTRTFVVNDEHTVDSTGPVHGATHAATVVQATRPTDYRTPGGGQVHLDKGDTLITYHTRGQSMTDYLAGHPVTANPGDLHVMRHGDTSLWAVGPDPASAQPVAQAHHTSTGTVYQDPDGRVFGTIDPAGHAIVPDGNWLHPVDANTVILATPDAAITVYGNNVVAPGIPAGAHAGAGEATSGTAAHSGDPGADRNPASTAATPAARNAAEMKAAEVGSGETRTAGVKVAEVKAAEMEAAAPAGQGGSAEQVIVKTGTSEAGSYVLDTGAAARPVESPPGRAPDRSEAVAPAAPTRPGPLTPEQVAFARAHGLDPVQLHILLAQGFAPDAIATAAKLAGEDGLRLLLAGASVPDIGALAEVAKNAGVPLDRVVQTMGHPINGAGPGERARMVADVVAEHGRHGLDLADSHTPPGPPPDLGHPPAPPPGSHEAERAELAEAHAAARNELAEAQQAQREATPPQQRAALARQHGDEWNALIRGQLAERQAYAASRPASAGDLNAYFGRMEQDGPPVLRSYRTVIESVILDPSPDGPGVVRMPVAFDVVTRPGGVDRGAFPAKTEVHIRIGVHPDLDVSPEKLAELMGQAQLGVDYFYNEPGYRLPDGTLLEVQVEFVTDPTAFAHHDVRFQAGPGESRQNLWHPEDLSIVAAHEVGHMLGFLDVYRTAGYDFGQETYDGTLMSNFYRVDGTLDTSVILNEHQLRSLYENTQRATPVPDTELVGDGVVRLRDHGLGPGPRGDAGAEAPHAPQHQVPQSHTPGSMRGGDPLEHPGAVPVGRPFEVSLSTGHRLPVGLRNLPFGGREISNEWNGSVQRVRLPDGSQYVVISGEHLSAVTTTPNGFTNLLVVPDAGPNATGLEVALRTWEPLTRPVEIADRQIHGATIPTSLLSFEVGLGYEPLVEGMFGHRLTTVETTLPGSGGRLVLPVARDFRPWRVDATGHPHSSSEFEQASGVETWGLFFGSASFFHGGIEALVYAAPKLAVEYVHGGSGLDVTAAVELGGSVVALPNLLNVARTMGLPVSHLPDAVRGAAGTAYGLMEPINGSISAGISFETPTWPQLRHFAVDLVTGALLAGGVDLRDTSVYHVLAGPPEPDPSPAVVTPPPPDRRSVVYPPPPDLTLPALPLSLDAAAMRDQYAASLQQVAQHEVTLAQLDHQLTVEIPQRYAQQVAAAQAAADQAIARAGDPVPPPSAPRQAGPDPGAVRTVQQKLAEVTDALGEAMDRRVDFQPHTRLVDDLIAAATQLPETPALHSLIEDLRALVEAGPARPSSATSALWVSTLHTLGRVLAGEPVALAPGGGPRWQAEVPNIVNQWTGGDFGRVLRPGPNPPGPLRLTGEDVVALADLVPVVRDYQAQGQPADLRHQIRLRLEELGLRDGQPGADRRWQAVTFPDDVAKVLGRLRSPQQEMSPVAQADWRQVGAELRAGDPVYWTLVDVANGLVQQHPDLVPGLALTAPPATGTGPVELQVRWGGGLGAHSATVRVEPAALPAGERFRVTAPPSESGTWRLEVSATLLADPAQAYPALASGLAAVSTELTVPGRNPMAWAMDRLSPPTPVPELHAGIPVPDNRPVLTGHAQGQWAAVAVLAEHAARTTNPAQRAALVTELHQQLTRLGLRDGQPGWVQRRYAIERTGRGVELSAEAARLVSPFTRVVADPVAVLHAVGKVLPDLAPDAGIQAAGKVDGQAVIRIQLPDQRLYQVPVEVVDSGPVVSLATTPDGDLGLAVQIRADANLPALRLGLAGALAELGRRAEGVTDPLTLHIAARLSQLRYLDAWQRVAGPLTRPMVLALAQDAVRDLHAGPPATGSHSLDPVFGADKLVSRMTGARPGLGHPDQSLPDQLRQSRVDSREAAGVQGRQPISPNPPIWSFYPGRIVGALIGGATNWATGWNFGKDHAVIEAQIAAGLVTNPYQAYEDAKLRLAQSGGDAQRDNRVAEVSAWPATSAGDPTAAASTAVAPATPAGPATPAPPAKPDAAPFFSKRVGPTALNAGINALYTGFFGGHGWTGPGIAGGSALAQGVTYGLADFWTENPERAARNALNQVQNLMPETERNNALKDLYFQTNELTRRLGLMLDAAPDAAQHFGPQERAALIAGLTEAREVLHTAQRHLVPEVRQELAGLHRRRALGQQLLQTVVGVPKVLLVKPGAWVLHRLSGGHLAATPAAPGAELPPGRAPDWQYVARVAAPALVSALGGLGQAAAIGSGVPLAEIGGASGVAAGVAGGAGWALHRDDEVADRQAIAAWYALHHLDQSMRQIDRILHALGPTGPAPLHELPWQDIRDRQGLWDRTVDAGRDIFDGFGTDRPTDAHGMSIFMLKHGLQITARLAAIGLVGPAALGIGKIGQIALNMGGAAANQTSAGAGEVVFRKLSAGASRRFSEQRDRDNASGLALTPAEFADRILRRAQDAWQAEQAALQAAAQATIASPAPDRWPDQLSGPPPSAGSK